MFSVLYSLCELMADLFLTSLGHLRSNGGTYKFGSQTPLPVIKKLASIFNDNAFYINFFNSFYYSVICLSVFYTFKIPQMSLKRPQIWGKIKFFSKIIKKSTKLMLAEIFFLFPPPPPPTKTLKKGEDLKTFHHTCCKIFNNKRCGENFSKSST